MFGLRRFDAGWCTGYWLELPRDATLGLVLEHGHYAPTMHYQPDRYTANQVGLGSLAFWRYRQEGLQDRRATLDAELCELSC